MADGGSYPGIVTQRPGGVGRNHADVLARLGLHSTLLTHFGDDENGNYLKRTGEHIDLSRCQTVPVPSATYFAMNVKGNVRYGISSIEKIMATLTTDIIRQNRDLLATSDFFVIDGNVRVETLKFAIEQAAQLNVPVWFEPTDIDKMQKLFKSELIDKVAVTSPNRNEFRELCRFAGVSISEKDLSSPKSVQDFITKNRQFFQNFKHLIVTMGGEGVVVCSREKDDLHILTRSAPLADAEVVSVSGAGDCWNGGFLAGWLLGKTVEERIDLAQETARKSLKSTFAVPETIQSLI
ncbi:unnamed protein product, partial [Mesorhabditis belari]|uniref:Carbohydrate kinase PfkB domain-containing protein n=1 Tax=Mesorhabditis belari TaxID=2138241 RepID=A0AAF3ER58_9BILA